MDVVNTSLGYYEFDEGYGGYRYRDLRRTTRPEIVKEYTDQEGVRQTAVLHKDDPRYTIRFPKEATANNPELN